MNRPGSPWATAVLVLVGLGSAVAVTGLLVRQVARERERTEKSMTESRSAKSEVDTLRLRVREAQEALDLERSERARRETVVQGELDRLRNDLAEATRQRDALRQQYAAAAAERDRVNAELLQARRDEESLRSDLARAASRAAEAERRAADLRTRADQAVATAADLRTRAAALLRPLLRDLRSPDSALRVRAHEALVTWAGRPLDFRPNGTPEQLEADAAAIEAALLPR